MKLAWKKTDDQYKVNEGTSFAAPLAAGVAAMYLQAHPSWTPAQVKKAILDSSLKGMLSGVKGPQSNNRLLNTGGIKALGGRCKYNGSRWVPVGGWNFFNKDC
jgi:subtilisin family serine protease